MKRGQKQGSKYYEISFWCTPNKYEAINLLSLTASIYFDAAAFIMRICWMQSLIGARSRLPLISWWQWIFVCSWLNFSSSFVKLWCIMIWDVPPNSCFNWNDFLLMQDCLLGILVSCVVWVMYCCSFHMQIHVHLGILFLLMTVFNCWRFLRTGLLRWWLDPQRSSLEVSSSV